MTTLKPIRLNPSFYIPPPKKPIEEKKFAPSTVIAPSLPRPPCPNRKRKLYDAKPVSPLPMKRRRKLRVVKK